MHRETLELIGLNKNEAIIYESLISLGESPLGAIATTTHIHRRNTLDSLKSLIHRGLVFEIHDQPRILYQAVEPQKLLELVHERETAILDVLPSLQKSYTQRHAEDRIVVYRGIEGFKNNLRDILRIGKPLYEIGSKGGWFSPQLEPFTKNFIRQFKAKNIPHVHLYDATVKELVSKEVSQLGGEYKFLHEKHSTSSVIHIFGNHVVTFTGLSAKKLKEDVKLFVIVSDELADSYRTWFQLLWESCK